MIELILSFDAERDRRFRIAAHARYQAMKDGADETTMARLNAAFERYFPRHDTQPPAITYEKAVRLREIGEETTAILATAYRRR
jgi:hypothetical protein